VRVAQDSAPRPQAVPVERVTPARPELLARPRVTSEEPAPVPADLESAAQQPEVRAEQAPAAQPELESAARRVAVPRVSALAVQLVASGA
jgi:hypothetical protein